MLNELKRREFLKQAILASGLLMIPPYLQNCKSSDKEGVQKRATSADAPFGIWRQMIEALEKSPDHYLGRRKALIAAKDPKAMTEFVRDFIQVLPQKGTIFEYSHRYTIFGAEGALRCGMGSPRDKAEILKDMLSEAGFAAKVVLEQIQFTPEEIKNIVFHSYKAEFNPPISKDQIEKWHSDLGASDKNGTVKKVSKSIQESEDFLKQFEKEITEDAFQKAAHAWKGPIGGVPSVVYTENGIEKFAHVFDPTIAFGSLHSKNPSNNFQEAGKADVLDSEVEVKLSYRNASNPRDEKELLSKSFSKEDLFGSTLSVQFLNNLDFKQQITHTISQINSFTPCFAFQKIGKNKEFMQERSLVGNPMNLNAKEIFSNDVYDGLSEQEIAKLSVPGNTADVEKVLIKAVPKVFPEVRLEIFPTDSSGKNVKGLTASNFIINDNGNPVYGRLEQNKISPKVRILYDTSMSMPEEYRERESMQAFSKELQNMVREFYPDAQITVQETGSEIYTSLLKSKQDDFDLIMYATDGDNDDTFDSDYLEVLNTGQPILILEVIPEHYTYAELKKNISNLISLPATNKDSLKQEISSILSNLSFPPYLLVYNSFDLKSEHTLKVKINDKEIEGSTKFKFPIEKDEYLGDRMIGLYLSLKIGHTEIRRTLAGWDNQIYYYKNSKDYVNQVHEMMLGGTVIAFEPEAPSLSIQLSEYLTSLLSNEKWFTSQREGEIEKAVDYLEKGTLSYPPLLLSMMQAPSEAINKESLTFPYGFRSCVLKFRPALYSPNSLFSFDYLPTSKYSTYSKSGDGKYNFLKNMEKTIQFGALESEMFPESTFAHLKDKKLMLVENARKEERFHYSILAEKDPIFLEKIFAEPNYTFFDESLKAGSYFKVDYYTGEVYSILPDGTGGGGISMKAQLDEIGRVLKEYEKLIAQMQLGIAAYGTINPVGGFMLGVIANYGVTLVKLYAAVSEALIIMDTSNLNEEIAKAMAQLACNVYKDILYLGYGKVGDGMAGLENLIGSMGGEFSFVSCPV